MRAEAMKDESQASLSQTSTFCPSNTKKGKRLKNARNALSIAPKLNTVCSQLPGGTKMLERYKRNAIEMLVIGPAMAVLPPISVVMGPDIITAPGASTLKGRKTDMRVMSMKDRFVLNSAQSPWR